MNAQNHLRNAPAFKGVPANDQVAFRAEWEALRSTPTLRLLACQANVTRLYQIYQLQIAEQNSFSLALRRHAWLRGYFQSFLDGGLLLPQRPLAQRVFLALAALPLAEQHLAQLLDTRLLDRLPGDRLQRLAKVLPANARGVVEYGVAARADLDLLGVDLLLKLPASDLGPGAGAQVDQFLRDVLILFVKRFANVLTPDQIYEKKDNIADWFLAWKAYVDQDIEYLEATDPYYQVGFDQIVQYLPLYLLWNGSMNFGRVEQAYAFHGPEFRHLALGGSFRNSLDGRYYSRRMARTLVQLPYNFPHFDYDLYLYAFCESLGVEGLLHEYLQQYIKLPEDPAVAKKMMDRWEPVIQKLAQIKVDGLPLDQLREVMGYVYHCVRDQPKFSLQRRGLPWLLRVSTVYYQNIQRRAEERAERRRQHQEWLEKYRMKEDIFWAPHKQVQPLAVKVNGEVAYRIVELCTKSDLENEGALMRHCVGDYENRCLYNGTSVWSLRELKNSRWYSLVTIELWDKSIRQARGRFNRSPNPEEQELIDQWRLKEGLVWEDWEY